MLLLTLVQLIQFYLIFTLVIVEDEMGLEEPVFYFFPIFLSSRLQALQERSTGVVDDCELALHSQIIPILQEAIFDTGVVSIGHLKKSNFCQHYANKLRNECVENETRNDDNEDDIQLYAIGRRHCWGRGSGSQKGNCDR